MSDNSRCYHCQNSPIITIRRRHGTRRCPLCHTETLITARGTFVCEFLPPVSQRTRFAVAGVSLACLVVVVLVGTALFLRSEESPQPPSSHKQAQAPAVAADFPSVAVTPAQSPDSKVDDLTEVKQNQIQQTVIDAPNEDPLPQPEEGMAEEQLPIVETVTTTEPTELEPAAATSEPRSTPIALQSLTLPDHELKLELTLVPEIGILQAATPTNDGRKKGLAHYKELVKLAQKHKDQLIVHLLKKRPELAGLPIRMGKECLLEKAKATILQSCSRTVRSAITRATSKNSYGDTSINVQSFWSSVYRELNRYDNNGALSPFLVPALHQMLTGEEVPLRRSYVSHLARIQGPAATEALVNRILFDTCSEIRRLATAILTDRPEKEYKKHLLAGLRYPWPSVASRAADAIVALELGSAVPELIAMLDELDPDIPFQKVVEGKKVWHRRQLVRINHFRNCVLCHAPSFSTNDPVPGLAPVPGFSVPKGVYNRLCTNSRVLVVRADVTYLKQDFSVLQSVKDASPWPSLQRFDFVVQTRPLTKPEFVEWNVQILADWQRPSPYKEAIRYALCCLTGHDAGTVAADWRSVVAESVHCDRGKDCACLE